MKISSLKIENFRGIHTLDIRCGNSCNIFAGENGAGKSTIVNAVRILLSWLTARIKNAKGRGISLSDSDISRGKNYCLLAIELSDGTYWQLVKQKSSDREKLIQATSLQSMTDLANKIAIAAQNEDDCQIPVFANYGVNRSVTEVPLRLKKKHQLSPIDVYTQLDNEIKFRTFFEWYREREDIDNANYRYEKKYRQDPQLSAVKKAVESVLKGYKNMRIERNPMALTIEKNGVKFDIKELSDGEKCYFSLVADIARQLATANTGLGNPLEGQGIILIDEIDLHLHPRWQSEILSGLTSTFPNCQFFITTHSPFVVSNVKKNEHYKFVLMQHGEPHEICDNIYGKEVNGILTDFFNIDSLRNPEVQNHLDIIWQSLADGDYKSDVFNGAFDWLKSNISQSDIEFAHINLEKTKLMRGAK